MNFLRHKYFRLILEREHNPQKKKLLDISFSKRLKDEGGNRAKVGSS